MAGGQHPRVLLFVGGCAPGWYPGARCPGSCTRVAIEVKTWRDSDTSRDPAFEGLDPLDAYLARIDAAQAWLVRFDPRDGQPPLPDRCVVDEVITPAGRQVTRILL